VFDYGEDRGRPYIVMELIEGETLAQHLERQGPVSPDEVARIGADVAAALAAAHEAGIVHRDVKPANIMLTRRAEVKVMDFGIAAEVLAGETGLTGTGMVLGTAKYLSPEQAQGKRATPASDIYALGAVLYELLAGRPPFEYPSPMATAMAHVKEVPTPLTELVPGIPPHLAGLVERCLAKDPKDRPASAAALAAELRGEEAAARDADTVVLPPADSTDVLDVGAIAGAQATAAEVAEEEATRPVRRPGAPRAGRPSRWSGMSPEGRRFLVVLAGVVILAVVLALIFTSGGGKVRVPTFVGKRAARAERLADRRGLAPTFSRRASVQRRGLVIRQIPHAGAEVPSGSEVILIVSSGGGGKTAPSPAPAPQPAGHGKGKGKGHGKGHDGD
jgi:serine/threonine-protein kinase